MLALGAIAMPASAEPIDRSGAPIVTAEAIGKLGDMPGDRTPGAIYDSLYAGTAGYWSHGYGTGLLGYDDYDVGLTPKLSAIKFVGGVTAAYQVIWFDFYTAGSSYYGSLGGMFPQGGTWIWTLNVSNPPFQIPYTGILQLVGNTTTYYGITNGAWFFTSADALIIGSNNPTFGPPPVTTTGMGQYLTVHNFALIGIPEPMTVGLLGLGLAALLIRRK